MRVLISRKGEPFAFVRDHQLFTLDEALTGYLEGDYIVDLARQPIWRLVGDGVYSLDGMETVGYLTEERREV